MAKAIHRIAVLCGRNPSELRSQLQKVAKQPTVPSSVAIMKPAELLRRRPDIRIAENALAAQIARVGIATADLFPKFSLAGLLGLQSKSLSDLISSGSRYWSIGPTISLSLFDRGKVRAVIEVKNALRDQALAEYEGAVLNALGEVETALVTLFQEQETLRILEEAVISGDKAVSIANGLYQSGLSDFLNVLQSERALYQSRDQLALSEQRLTQSFVALFKALGGGWQNEEKNNTAPRADHTTGPDRQNNPPEIKPT